MSEGLEARGSPGLISSENSCPAGGAHLLAVMEALKIVLAKGGACCPRVGFVEALAEVHPERVAPPHLPRSPEPGGHLVRRACF